ncbi:sushi, von Willebrand factor type A, EGF and pentraxin domain-containing protein 1 isoform X2 [Drosophila mojavensis]|uniref:sushi, von Willebrand factor type A, EGF and pentraxin domain-containing protein 1 isoform X2 n=1 Tax=Drosophila mojavensis TaxID=7230 RepID=UPI001CD18EE6|nr:sushi, von Willebrand factor type A, EGF and pentraxin domain-containing protein 1 isoform X2 [Drosophila mojavensis]
MPRAHFALCLLGCIALSGVAHAVYEDCKTPPPVDHARAELYEDGDINTALYSCSRGYVIEGPTELICNVTTEEWQGDPPYCSPIFHDDEYYDEYETIDEKDLENDSAEGEDPVAPPPPPPPVEKAEQEQLEELEAIDEDEEDEEDEETSLTPQRQPQPLAEAETIAESTAPVQAPAGLEPTIVVHVDEPQPEEAVQPEPELQAEPKAEVHPVAGGAAPVTDINIVVEPTEDPFTPRLLDENCGEDRGGCAHKCERLLFPGENEPRLKCSCNEGYTLDPQDYATCHDIDECLESNGGCAEICNNLPGTHECACRKGYQIKESDGSCEDIDECAQPEVQAECNNACENTPGSYRCVIPLDTKQEAVEEPEEPEQGKPVEEPTDVEEPAVQKPSCNAGFVLSQDGKECQDINECEIVVEDNENADHVPHRICQQLCENTIGSYRCSCREGFHLQEDGSSCVRDGCDDLDNPQLSRRRCAHECEDLPSGGYACRCPDGYRLAEDLHSCEVLETVCSREQGHERCRPGSCVANEANGTFSCLCPPGYASDVYSCQDLDECALGTHKCSHDCFNTAGGYQCLCPRGMSLQEPEGHTCVAPDPCAFNNNGCEQLCLSADGGACTCSKGYVLSADQKSCQDVDECAVNNGNCQQLCRNLPGGHACACERGYELQPDGQTCQDVDECAGLLSGGCTHECINKPGSYECGCPLGYLLQEDERSCRPAPVGCPPGSRQTDQGCQPIECAVGLLLGADGSCVDIDECRLNNGGCSHTCRNTQGSYQCACPAGYQLAANARDCQDVDECARANGGCEGSCINEPGSFRCECEPGKRLSFDERSCYAVPAIEPRVAPFPLAPRAPVAPAAPAAPPAPPVMPVRPLPTLRPVTFLEPTVTPAVASAPLPPLPTLPIQPAQPLPSFQVRDQCQRFQAPANGQAHCNRYRHKRKLFYNTRCKVRCNPGYQLIGSEIRSCGASGNWEGQENKCVPVSQPRLWPSIATSRAQSACPALPTPRNGVISPASCTLGPSSFGSICLLRCNMGYVQVGPMSTTCFNGWSLGPLECKPLDSNFFGNQLSTQMQSPWQQQAFNLPQQPAFRPPQAIQRLPARPYIRCPENVVILLGPLQSRAHVILQRPATNVDYRHVVAFPAWAKQLEAHLPAGTHKIVYRAHDPATALSVACQTIITIKRASTPNALPSQFPSFRPAAMSAYRPAPSPQFSSGSLPARPYAHLTDARSESLIAQPPAEPIPVTSSATRSAESTRIDLGSSSSRFCPPSFEVYLKENQNLRSVVWEEPRFEGKLLKIYKSSFPGALFGRGDHDIRYEATTTDGRTQQCSFQIRVKGRSARGLHSQERAPANVRQDASETRHPHLAQASI